MNCFCPQAIAALLVASTATLATAQSASPADPFEERIARLAPCKPTSERDALRCLDRLLTPEDKRFVLALPYDHLRPSYDDGWSAALFYAWEEPDRPSRLRLYYRRYGYPVESDWSLGATLLESYWLKHHRCRLDHEKRAERERSIVNALTAEAALVRKSPEMRGLTHPDRDMVAFRPSCGASSAVR